MKSPKRTKRLRPSLDSPSKELNLEWVPEGMDPSSACRVLVRVPGYVEVAEDGRHVFHETKEIKLVVDRDKTNLKDLLDDIAAEVKCGSSQGINVTYWNKVTKAYCNLTSDSQLLDALDNYWAIRRLHLSAAVYDTLSVTYTQQLNSQSTEHLQNLGSEQLQNSGSLSVEPAGNSSKGDKSDDIGNSSKGEKSDEEEEEEPWEEDEVEYVGLNDENQYLPAAQQPADSSDYEPSELESSEVDELLVDDDAGCEIVEHTTNLENPTIAVGLTFEDGDTFKRAIRQYAVLNEFEIAAPYSESRRYRGYCKGTASKKKKCKWRIHASELQDGKTWQIKKIQSKHTCASTAKLDHNCMATNAWVRDRVIDTLRDEPTIGAAELKKQLEKKYSIKLSYYVVWDGRQMALEEINGKWDESFEEAFNFKAEVERTNPGIFVHNEYAKVGKKMRFTKMFVALKACVDGFLNGCRPFLGVDSTVLTGRWRGQLASACAVDGHNWLFPVAYGVFESEELAVVFEQPQRAIGSPPGLVISTDAGKGIDSAVTSVFSNGVEHRECMRHLVKNFQKRAYSKQHYEYHYNIMKKASPNAIKWIEDSHKHLWNRWKFSPLCKCDYVTNNIAETFNSWVRNEKSQGVIQLMDRIRQMIMQKMDMRRRLATKLTDKILPHIIKELHGMSRNLQYVIHKGHDNTAEIQGTTQSLKTWRHSVDLDNRTCTCNKWQITGLPCTHALSFINSLRNRSVEDYVDDYYSVAKFKKVYEGVVMPMTDRTQWPRVDMGFKLWPPLLKRSAGRPRTRRIMGVEEGGKIKKQMKCKRCGQFGHMMKTCNETVYDSDAPPPAPPKPKRVRNKKTTTSTASTQQSQTGGCSTTPQKTARPWRRCFLANTSSTTREEEERGTGQGSQVFKANSASFIASDASFSNIAQLSTRPMASFSSSFASFRSICPSVDLISWPRLTFGAKDAGSFSRETKNPTYCSSNMYTLHANGVYNKTQRAQTEKQIQTSKTSQKTIT
ncbi:LOW QUALITY PROTEIN: hypothetical protein U9M48_022615 [Paspalum notatum var. saurae]|uniref:SWIM-type domain-containing protein n=1 Tax=Paspalum notatum var. saurae TaxID=547442 RepID=A0AAQ3WVC4_PASNO